MKDRAFKIIRKILIVLTGGIIYGIFIIKTGLKIPCLFRTLTGFKCPGCGVTSMCLALMNLDFHKAFISNKMLFILIPALLFVFVKYIFVYIKTGEKNLDKLQSSILNISLVMLIVFGIIRNLL